MIHGISSSRNKPPAYILLINVDTVLAPDSYLLLLSSAYECDVFFSYTFSSISWQIQNNNNKYPQTNTIFVCINQLLVHAGKAPVQLIEYIGSSHLNY